MTENDTAAWRTCAGLAAGSKHELHGGENPVWTFERPAGEGAGRKPPRGPEDRYFVGTLNGVVCAVVCDGASSGYYAAEGAEFYSRYAAAYFTRRFEECWNADPLGLNDFAAEFHQKAILALNQRIAEQARLAGRPCEPVLSEGADGRARVRARELEQYSTTMLLAMISNGRLVAACIGNGACLAVRGGRIGPLCDFTNKRDDPGLTPFVNRSTYSELLRLMRWQRAWLPPDLRGVYLMTDGGGFPGGLYWGTAPQQALLELIPRLENGGGAPCIGQALAALRGHEGNLAQDDITLAALLRRDLSPLELPLRPGEHSPLANMELYRRSQQPAPPKAAAPEKPWGPAGMLRRLRGEARDEARAAPAPEGEGPAFDLPACVDTEAPVRLPPVVRVGGPDDLADLGKKRLLCFTGRDAQQRMKMFLLRLALKCDGTRLSLAAADFMPQRPLAWLQGTLACTAPNGASLYFRREQEMDRLAGALNAWRGKTQLVVAFAGTGESFRLLQRLCPWLTETEGVGCALMGDAADLCQNAAFVVGPGGRAPGEIGPAELMERRIAQLPRVPLWESGWSETRPARGEVQRERIETQYHIAMPYYMMGEKIETPPPESRRTAEDAAERENMEETAEAREADEEWEISEAPEECAAEEEPLRESAAEEEALRESAPEESEAEKEPPAGENAQQPEGPAAYSPPPLFERLGVGDLNELRPRPNGPALIEPMRKLPAGQEMPGWDVLLFASDCCGGPLVRTVLEQGCIVNNPQEFGFWLFSREQKMIFRILEHLPHCQKAQFGLEENGEFRRAAGQLAAELEARAALLARLAQEGRLPRPEQALYQQAWRMGELGPGAPPMPTLLAVLDGVGELEEGEKIPPLPLGLLPELGARLMVTGRPLPPWPESGKYRILHAEPVEKQEFAAELLWQDGYRDTLRLPNDQSPWGDSEVQLSALVYRMRELYGEG